MSDEEISDSELLDISDSDSSEASSLGPEYRERLGDEIYDRLADWLWARCNRYLALHKNRDTGRGCREEALASSWMALRAALATDLPEIPETFREDTSCWGIRGMWEDEIFQGWMLLPEAFQPAASESLSSEDAVDLARLHYSVGTADVNLTECICDLLRAPPDLARARRAVQAATETRSAHEGLDVYTQAFNMPAADDIVRHILGIARAD